jgi:hypothetical protein
MRTIETLSVLAAAITVTACGGGGGGGSGLSSQPPAPQTATGYFKDNNVSGLGYTSGAHSGVTGADASFVYEVGQPVSFNVGGVVLGSAAGRRVITPIDLISGGQSDSVRVRNIVRFLLMLDDDGDPSNGISISAELADIIADVQSVDGRPRALVAIADAVRHVEDTFFCVYSGAFRGTYSGDDSGRFGLLVTRAGEAIGFGASDAGDGGYFIAEAGTHVAPVRDAAFVAGSTSTGASFAGQFDTPDAISGQWRNVELDESGTFSGSRVGGVYDAVHRFTGFFATDQTSPEPDIGLFTLDVDANGAVSGLAYSVPYDELHTLAGSVAGDTVTGTVDASGGFEGSLVRDSGVMLGKWSDPSGNFGTFVGTGCALN